MKILLRILFLVLPFFWSVLAMAQRQGSCTTCFDTEVVSVREISGECVEYEWRVSYAGACTHALSHFTAEIPCGEITGLWNSEGWKQEIGLDPTSGISGFKIDDIPEFGKTSLPSFTVRFQVCSGNIACEALSDCWESRVAYKAGPCVHYDTVATTCQTLTASLEKRDVSCYGSDDGTLEVKVSGGTEPFTFLWSDGATDGVRQGLSPGTYTVVVRDASGAEFTLSETIDSPAEVVIDATVTDVACGGDGVRGAIDLHVSGGSGTFDFAWANGSATEDIFDLDPGTYPVVVTDAATGCSVEASFDIDMHSNVVVTADVTPANCKSADGMIDLHIAGGAAPYSFEWSTGQTSEDLSGLDEGFYEVLVTDDQGCKGYGYFVVRATSPVKITAQVMSTDCDENTGEIQITVEGGSEPYDLVWSDGSTDEDRNHLPAGSYSIAVIDANGCSAEKSFILKEKAFSLEAIVTKPTCSGATDGSISLLEPVGGEPPYQYEWSNGATTDFVDGLSAGMYSVKVTDASGCSQSLAFYVSNPPRISASHSYSNAACNAEGSYTIDLSVSGGAGNYAITWPDGVVSEDREGMNSGWYIVSIADSAGCSAEYEFEVAATDAEQGCMINPLDSLPSCGSARHILSTSVEADLYSWTVESEDGSWTIETGEDTNTISFSSGNENSSAIFTLTITNGNCTSSCVYVVASCVNGVDDGGDTNPGDTPDDGADDESCDECFETNIRKVISEGDCDTYEAVVTTSGACARDLSHWTIELPCGDVGNIWTSGDWKIEIGTDPTTGLTGFKVDEIENFGSEPASFTVRFMLCSHDGCDMSWEPVIAYKAGQCVALERPELEDEAAMTSFGAYPNPFREEVMFEWSVGSDAPGTLEVFDQFGQSLGIVFKGEVRHGKRYQIPFSGAGLNTGLYYYKFSYGSRTIHGKLFRK